MNNSAIEGIFAASKLLLIALVCALLIWLNFKPAPQWEYKIASVPDLEFQSGIDALGAQGWELVSARRASNGEISLQVKTEYSYEMIFKRPAERRLDLSAMIVTK